MNDELLTRSEVQKILRVSTSKVFRLIHNGALPAIRVGDTYRIKQSDLEKYLNSKNNSATSKEVVQ